MTSLGARSAPYDGSAAGKDDPGFPPAATFLVAMSFLWVGLLGWFFLSPRVARTPELASAPRPAIAHTLGPLVLTVLLVVLLGSVSNLSRRATAIIVTLVMVVLSAGTELVQGFTPGRSMEAADLGFDLVGTGMGLAMGLALAELAPGRTAVLRGLNIMVSVMVIAAATAAFSFRPPRVPETGPCEPSPDVIALAEHRPPILSLPLDLERDPSPPIELEFSEAGFSQTSDGRAMMFDGGVIRTSSPARQTIESIMASDELTIEAVIDTHRLDQEGPARIATISNGSSDLQVNAMLGIEGDTVVFRLRTHCSYFEWFSTLSTLPANRQVHLAAVYGSGRMRIFVDGHQFLDEPVGDGDLDNWDPDFRIALGNETNGDGPFTGRIHAVHIWDRALGIDELADRVLSGAWDR